MLLLIAILFAAQRLAMSTQAFQVCYLAISCVGNQFPCRFTTMQSFVSMISVPVRIVDPSKDLHSYGVGSVDWKERVESWKVKQDKNMLQLTHKYPVEGKGDIEGTGSNGEDLQMYGPFDFTYVCSAFSSLN